MYLTVRRYVNRGHGEVQVGSLNSVHFIWRLGLRKNGSVHCGIVNIVKRGYCPLVNVSSTRSQWWHSNVFAVHVHCAFVTSTAQCHLSTRGPGSIPQTTVIWSSIGQIQWHMDHEAFASLHRIAGTNCLLIFGPVTWVVTSSQEGLRHTCLRALTRQRRFCEQYCLRTADKSTFIIIII